MTAGQSMIDEYEDRIAMKRKQKQRARRVVFPPDRVAPPGKKMPVTVRDPLSRRIVKRKA
jgi:hypothetical protein